MQTIGNFNGLLYTQIKDALAGQTNLVFDIIPDGIQRNDKLEYRVKVMAEPWNGSTHDAKDRYWLNSSQMEAALIHVLHAVRSKDPSNTPIDPEDTGHSTIYLEPVKAPKDMRTVRISLGAKNWRKGLFNAFDLEPKSKLTFFLFARILRGNQIVMNASGKAVKAKAAIVVEYAR